MTSNTTNIDLHLQQVKEITVHAGESVHLKGAHSIESVSARADGSLVLKTDAGATLIIKNFSEVAKDGSAPQIVLDDGATLSLAQLEARIEHSADDAPGAAAQKAAQDIVVDKPAAHENIILNLDKDTHYTFGFNPQDVKSVENKDGQLVISFADGGHLIVPNYGEGKLAHIDFKDGSALATLSETHQDLANHATAEKLAGIEPAAGETGSSALGGHNLGGVFTPDALNSIGSIGPIGPTALEYQTFDRQPLAQIEDLDGANIVITPPPPVVFTPPVPQFSVHDVEVKEDHSVQLQIEAQPENANQSITLTITGFAPGWTFVDLAGGTFDSNTGTWSITLNPGDSFSGGPTVTPPANSDIDLLNLQVTEHVTDTVTGLSSDGTGHFDINVDAVVDPITVDASNTRGKEGQPIAIEIEVGASVDTDGSEHVTQVILSGVPQGVVLNHGVLQGDGTWLLSTQDLQGLTMTSVGGFFGTAHITVTATEAESVTLNPSGPGNHETDTSDNTTTVTTTFQVEIDHTVPVPHLTAQDVCVKEDGSVQLNIAADLGNTTAGDHLVISVSGFAPGWTFVDLAGGTFDSNTGTWSITLNPGQNFSGGPTVAPPANSDIDLNGLHVTAVATDGHSSSTADTSHSIFVDAVVDPVMVDASNVSGSDNKPIALNIRIDGSVDTDGSEKITDIVIKGVPDGASLSAGIKDPLTGEWHLTVDQLNGLKFNPVRGFEGVLNLTVSVTETELAPLHTSGPGNHENDLSDNVAVDTTTFSINVKDTEPTITKTNEECVDETDLSHGPVVVKNTVEAKFFSDGPGTITGSGLFNADGSLSHAKLTSNGVLVKVELVGNTYVGTAGENEIFTLKILPDGQYTFTLKGTLDHGNPGDPDDSILLTFGVTATDADGDHASGAIKVTVHDDAPMANDDFNFFSGSKSSTGNVITGLNGGFNGADDLSQDGHHTITKVTFGGVDHVVFANGETVIEGDFGTLKILADGSYTYTLKDSANATNGGIPPGTDEFVYTMQDADGDTSTASLFIHGQQPAHLDGNILSGGSGADIFHIGGHSPGQGVDTVKDFCLNQGDKLDIKDVLAGFDPLHDHIENFVSMTSDGHGNTLVAVDPNGHGHFQTLAVLEGVTIDTLPIDHLVTT